ncbi:MAG: hypothetical protein PUP93_26385 [Rhizonema sp. NSF051]|nr:hypothetical protein [Rhizonema sp. NSF051]
MSSNGTENRDKKIKSKIVGGTIILPFGRLILPIFFGNVMLLMPTMLVTPKILVTILYKIHRYFDEKVLVFWRTYGAIFGLRQSYLSILENFLAIA